MQKALAHSDSDCPIFVLENSTYGEKQGRAFKKFAMELDNNSILKKNEYADNYIFKDALLIEAAWNYNESKIDSIVQMK